MAPSTSSVNVCGPDGEMCIGIAMYIVTSLSIMKVAPESDIGTPQLISCGGEIRVIFDSEQVLTHQVSINPLIPRGQRSWLGLDNAQPGPTDAVQGVGVVEVKQLDK